ncbi:MAG: acyl-CoA dehydratase activase [Candidatus Adiutrix sp.]|jgi:predicted CoA-substrate-specific enzyme activase|nr:acyl-CoA dehydratase activase [Candidatus Adiutrix sp.]
MRAAIGIDCGSTFCKGALYADGRVAALAVRPTGWDLAAAGRRVLADLLEGRPEPALPEPADDVPVVATGYGREKIPASRTVTEITCHARGAEYLRPGVRCVIDVGGQDYKVIAVRDGKVQSFQMNDKCAAGSGRFLEMVLHRLEVPLEQLDALLAEEKSVALNSTCVVFAESEVIGLLAQGVSRAEILGGVAASMAAKIAGQAARVGLAAPAVLTGGLSASRGISRALTKSLGLPVEPIPDGLYAGAIGAACLAFESGLR